MSNNNAVQQPYDQQGTISRKTVKPRIQLIVKWPDARCTDVQIDGDLVTPAMFDATEDLAHTLTTGDRVLPKDLYTLVAQAFNTTATDTKCRIMGTAYGKRENANRAAVREQPPTSSKHPTPCEGYVPGRAAATIHASLLSAAGVDNKLTINSSGKYVTTTVIGELPIEQLHSKP